MSKQFKITLTVPADDQADMHDGDYTLEDFQQIMRESVTESGWLHISNLKVTSITVEEVK